MTKRVRPAEFDDIFVHGPRFHRQTGGYRGGRGNGSPGDLDELTTIDLFVMTHDGFLT